MLVVYFRSLILLVQHQRENDTLLKHLNMVEEENQSIAAHRDELRADLVRTV